MVFAGERTSLHYLLPVLTTLITNDLNGEAFQNLHMWLLTGRSYLGIYT
jgi:hypothetical protein